MAKNKIKRAIFACDDSEPFLAMDLTELLQQLGYEVDLINHANKKNPYIAVAVGEAMQAIPPEERADSVLVAWPFFRNHAYSGMAMARLASECGMPTIMPVNPIIFERPGGGSVEALERNLKNMNPDAQLWLTDPGRPHHFSPEILEGHIAVARSLVLKGEEPYKAPEEQDPDSLTHTSSDTESRRNASRDRKGPQGFKRS